MTTPLGYRLYGSQPTSRAINAVLAKRDRANGTGDILCPYDGMSSKRVFAIPSALHDGQGPGPVSLKLMYHSATFAT